MMKNLQEERLVSRGSSGRARWGDRIKRDTEQTGWGKGTAAHHQPASSLRYFKRASGSELDRVCPVGGDGVV